ncbi:MULTISPECIES: hypothetical protein [Methylorubrum]|uniref:hypothetical protein n=1 Tax=Methylorubrum TaxID=2282523 RepID=UPI00209D1458|nr:MULTISPECIES: hypothetical protein [Methylorubrum]MCP1550203.1 hypothetical protein [Methylorubrum zatmanii]MCP1553183.1 hypothetical protein [Methylorubrum extorquens]MCP1580505.1 hypothetical protein [Methylorubrum extorquens]
MSESDGQVGLSPLDVSENADLWRTAAAIMAFDIDGGGALAFRHASGQVGTLSAEDNLNGRMRLVDERSGEISTYDSVNALIRDGWSLCENADAPPYGR